MTARDALARTLYGEARGESTAGRIAVGCVIRNRVHDGRFGVGYEGVCLAPAQFSCWNEGDPNRALLLGLTDDDVEHSPVLRECYWIADGLLANVVTYGVGNATHYYAMTLHDPPKWAMGAKLVARVGQHLFFSGVK